MLDEAQVTVAMTRLDQIWDRLLPAEQQRIVRLLVEKVIISLHDIEIKRLHECHADQQDRRAPGHPCQRRTPHHLGPNPDEAAQRRKVVTLPSGAS